ncbi:MAG: hypothetical protein MUO97_07245 [Dehalococcoidia bacterium]|nr:hypothetical protein [Dehalococcoidia bacterium]
MMQQSISFAITDGIGRRAATWKCWAHTGKKKSDIYLACRELGGYLKISLHQSGDWRIAYTQEFFKENLSTFPDKRDNRVIMQWPRPPQIAEGITLAFRIITPYSAVSTALDIPLPKHIISIPVPPDNRAVEIAAIITAPYTLVSNWPGRNSMDTQLIGLMVLDSGETVWIVHRVTDIPDLGTLQAMPRFFNGKDEDDLARAQSPRVLVFGNEKDGSRVIIDSTIEKLNSYT